MKDIETLEDLRSEIDRLRFRLDESRQRSEEALLSFQRRCGKIRLLNRCCADMKKIIEGDDFIRAYRGLINARERISAAIEEMTARPRPP